jgi:hypothetical protein
MCERSTCVTASRSAVTPRLANWRASPEGVPAPEAGANSTAELFDRGDYVTVARKGGAEEWQTYAALGLIGKTQEALEGLARFPHPEPDFYTAVTRWIGGEDDAVPALLERIPTEHARNLLTLLRKPQIEVLAQWPWRRDGCSDLLRGAAADARFRVRNISFHPDDLPNKPYADVRDYCASGTPDFYSCTMVEWHLVPPNLPQLACPLFGQTADYDLHIQTVYPWLGLFDALLVTDPSEWRDVSQLVSGPVYTFPKSFGVPHDLPPLTQGQRDTDIYWSGTLLHPYHPDKAQLLHQLLDADGLRVKVLNGFADPSDYHKELATSKICITYVRHPAALPTRGLEALAMGCVLLVQEDSVLTLFAGDEQGVRTYRLEQNDLPELVRSIDRRWPEYGRKAEVGARAVRQEFSLEKVASQYLRFLTFLAARPRGPRTLQNAKGLTQKRCVLEKGWLPSNELSSSPVLMSMAVHNERRLRAAVKLEPASAHALIDLAREAVLANCHRVEAGLIPAWQWLAYLHKTYREACRRFPHCLIARFNAIRVMLHFGTDELVAEALALLDETLQFPAGAWRIDAMEDVFPWDFFPQFFNYREYFDRLTAHLMRGSEVEADLCRLLRASLHAYRGFYPQQHGIYSQSLDDYQAAAALDPAFPYYRLWYAEQLLQRNLDEDSREAAHILRKLVENSLVFQEAFALLEKCGEPVRGGDRWDGVARRAVRAGEVLRTRETLSVPDLQPDPRNGAWKRRNVLGERETRKDQRVQLSRHIRAKESSKFWKLRQAWFGLKRCLGLASR